MTAHLQRATGVAVLVLASLVVAPAAAHAVGPVDNRTAGRSLDPFNKEKIKKLRPILKEWIEEEGMDEGNIQESDEKVKEFTDALKNLPFFNPLARRP